MTSSNPLLRAEDLAQWQGFLLLDTREPEQTQKGHLTGAVHVSPKLWDAAAKRPETSLDNKGFWADEIGALGIDGTRKVAVYDDGRLTDAARVWFFLQHFGVDAYVVDGGWPHIEAVAGNTTSGPLATAERVTYAVGAERSAELLDRRTLSDRLGGETQIWDARTKAEYDGQDARKNPRPGRIPGARLVNHLELIGEDGRLLPKAALRDLLGRAGLTPDRPVVAYCEGGGRAALAALAAVAAGYAGAGAYYLSFADWSPDTSCPVEV